MIKYNLLSRKIVAGGTDMKIKLSYIYNKVRVLYSYYQMNINFKFKNYPNRDCTRTINNEINEMIVQR